MSEIGNVTAPRLPTPPGACDTHMHIFEPEFGANFPSLPGTVAEYRKLRTRLGLTRSVIVQPTAYGNDNRCTLMAMGQLADEQHQTRGVAIVNPEDTDTEIARLHQLGIRGLRYHMLPGGGVTWATMPEMAARVAAYGWHVQVQMDGGEFAAHAALLAALPCDLVIDHIGRFAMPLAANDVSWKALRALVDNGRCWVKLSAPYHTSKSGPPAYVDAAALAAELISAAPERMLYATNWPHPSLKNEFPDDAALLDLLGEWAGSEAVRERVLVANPARLYGF